MYASVVSAAKNPVASSRDVASSTYTISVHLGPRSSNQSRGEPSICTRSPTHSRRGRLGCSRSSRRAFGRQSPSSVIQPRSVSADSLWPYSSSSFWLANVGPKSRYRLRTSFITASRNASSNALFDRLPRRPDARPAVPRSR